MGLVWRQLPITTCWHGHEPSPDPASLGLLAAQVVRYCETRWERGEDGLWRVGEEIPYWVGWISNSDTCVGREHRRYRSAEDAMRAVEAHLGV